MICTVVVLSLFRLDVLAFVNALTRVQLNQRAALIELGSVTPLPSAKTHVLMSDVEASARF